MTRKKLSRDTAQLRAEAMDNVVTPAEIAACKKRKKKQGHIKEMQVGMGFFETEIVTLASAQKTKKKKSA